MSQSDQAVAQAVIRHHSRLAAALNGHVAAIVDAAERNPGQVGPERDEFAAWLHTELLPHARAEEVGLYPAAAARPEGRLLVQGMIAEHRLIASLADEVERADSATGAVGTARALQAVLTNHVEKENALIIPLLRDAQDVSLAEALRGAEAVHGEAEQDAPTAGGCGGAGACGCGGDGASADAEAPVLSIDRRLDVREIPHGQRHALVLEAVESLSGKDALVIVAPHAPRPLLAEIDARFGGRIGAEWLQEGPDVWQVRLSHAV